MRLRQFDGKMMAMTTLTLPALLHAFVTEKVQRGDFRNEQEVIEAALQRLMLDELPDQKLEAAIRRDIEISEAQIAAGKTIPFEEFAAEMRARFGIPKR